MSNLVNVDDGSPISGGNLRLEIQRVENKKVS